MSESFVYPQVGISTNDKQIRHLQHKLLMSSYQQRVIPKKLKGSVYQSSKQLNNNQYQPQDNAFYNNQNQLRNLRTNQMKQSWAHQLDQQILIKQLRQKQQKIKNLQEQIKCVKDNKHLENVQRIRDVQFLKQIQKQAQQSYKFKQFKKKEQKNNQIQQKQYFRQRYSLNNLAFEDSHDRINKKGESDPTKKYYEQIMQQRKQLGMQENPEYSLNRNDELKKTQIKKMSNMFPWELKQVQQKYFQRQRKNQHQIQLSLKQTLLQQIKTSQSKKKQQRQKQFNSPYSNPQYKSIYHPIYNPVDIRIGKDNPYILKQLAKGIVQVNQKASYLSRKGSQSLLK